MLIDSLRYFKKFSLALLVGGLIFAIFVAPRTSWNFLGDDFCAVYAGKRGCALGLGQFWTDYSNEQTTFPSNVQKQASFLSVMFRPLTLTLYAAQYFLFGHNSAWPYFLVAIFLHCLAAGLLFLLLCTWFDLSMAFLLALCVGCYPLMGRFVGRLSIDSYSVCFIILMLCTFLLHKHLEKISFWPLIFVCGLFLTGLLCNEILLPMPLLYFLPILFVDQSSCRHWRYFYFFCALMLAVVFYLLLRLYFYPLVLTDNALLGCSSTTLTERFYYLLTLLTDTFALTSFSEGNRCIKSLGVTFFGLILTVGFAFSDQKKLLLGLLFAFCIAAWPCIIFYHAHRYLYFSTPIFLVALAICARVIFGNFVTHALFLILILVGIFECNRSLWAFEQQALQSSKIAKSVARFMDQNNVAICFALMSMEIFPGWGSAQAVWLYAKKELPVFYDKRLNTQSNFNNNVYCKIPDENLFTLDFDDSTIKIEALFPDKIWLFDCIKNKQTNVPFGLGLAEKICTREDGMLSGIQIKVAAKFLQQPLAIAFWDYFGKVVNFKTN